MHLARPLSDANTGEARRISVAQILVYELRVRDAMSKPPITATPTDTLRAVQQLMKARRSRACRSATGITCWASSVSKTSSARSTKAISTTGRKTHGPQRHHTA